MPTPYNSQADNDNALSITPPNHAIIKQARMALGLSLQQMADSCGINIRQYQKFESGERQLAGCSFSLGLRICKELNLDPWLFLDSSASNAKSRKAGPNATTSIARTIR